MARKVEEIQAGIILDVQAIPELAEASSTSRRALWRLWSFVVASAIMLLEQIIDVFRDETDLKISKAIPGTRDWLAQKILEFQYSATAPQIVQLVDLAPLYPILDKALRLVTRVSVVSTISNRVIIKTAKNEPPEPLTPTELAALQSYVNIIGVAGITYNCLSSDADRLYIDAEVFYDGQYSTVIAGTVNNAIDVFLASLPFNGVFKVSDLEIVIRNVTGVNDVLINNLKVRAESTAFSSGTFLVQNKTTISRIFPTISGYIIAEDSTPNLIAFTAN